MVAGVDVPIDLGDRIKTLKAAVASVGRQTVDGRAHKAVLEGFHKPKRSFLNRTTYRQPRSEGFDTRPFATSASCTRKKALKFVIEFVCAGARFDRRDSAREFAVLGGVGIRQ